MTSTRQSGSVGGMARVVVATAFGGPEVLSVVEEPVDGPGAGEVRLAVRAAGINPVDWKRYSGSIGAAAGLPMRLGFEVAGVVTEVGSGAVGPAGPVAVGDEVIAYRVDGGYADELVVAASTVVPKPAVMSWEQAGGLMLAGATAMHALAATGVGAGETVLVHAAAGGVGLMVVQIAVARGAHVVGTASEGHHEYLRKLGAEATTYGDGLADRVRALAPDGVDAAIDCVGTDEAVDVSLELVADRDRIASIAAFPRGGEVGIKMLGNGPGADPGTELRNAARPQLTALVEQGKLRVRARSFALDDVAEAHREGQAGHITGKLVLVPPSS
jgi:NADPH2:quinone reductase